MELWIRSQNKDKLFKINGVDITKMNDNSYEITGYTTYDIYLGKYKTIERALEVLDEIQELIKPKQIITTYESEIKECINKTKFDVVMTPKIDNIQLIEPTTLVYEMPAE